MLLETIFAIGAAQAFVLGVLIQLKPHKTLADYLLTLEMVLIGLIVLLFAYKDQICLYTGNLSVNSFTLGYLCLPVFYFYVRSQSGELKKLEWKHTIHLLPFLFANGLLFTFFYHQPFEDKVRFLKTVDIGLYHHWFIYLYFGLFLGVFPYYLYASLKVVRQYEGNLLSLFSNTDNLSLRWLARFIQGMFLVWISFLGFEVLSNTIWDISPDGNGYIVPFFTMIGLVFYLGFYGLKDRIVFTANQEISIPDQIEANMENAPSSMHVDSYTSNGHSDKYQHSSLTEAQIEAFLERLLRFMKEEKPYLEPKISIRELSQRVDIPVNYLSQIINDRLGQNFFDFINSYRVKEFQTLVKAKEAKKYTLLSIAFEAGFNSKSTFNAIFKKMTGQTPSEYVKVQQR